MIYPNFKKAIGESMTSMLGVSTKINTGNWQSTDILNEPSMSTYELLNHSIQVTVSTEDLTPLRKDIQPNLPWADDHFKERMGGWPLNPGKQWANWPWGNKADTFRDSEGRFSHTYMERYWPVYAGMVEDSPYYSHFVKGKATGVKLSILNKGIRYNYGDLRDVVKLLVKYPDTRQAYLPVWFPEDTGVVHGERVPCSLGYHFIQRHGYFHCIYYIRSCDIYRHFRDDIYLTVRLMLAVLNMCRELGPIYWDIIKPGIFTMYTTSLHMFVNDRQFIQQVVDNIDQNL